MTTERSGKSGIDTGRRWEMLHPNAMSAPPLISVIVVCKNPGERIRGALVSVYTQEYASWELVVIDGGSTDGTAELLAAEPAGRITHFQSAPDGGAYDAMNRGVALAKGRWVLFLGADDELASSDLFETIVEKLESTKAHVVVGQISYDDGRVYALPPSPSPIMRNFVHHQGAFYRRELFTGAAQFDTSLRIMADYDFNLRLWIERKRFAPLPLRVALCGSRGLSDSGGWQGYREEIRVRHRHFAAWKCLLWDLGSIVRFLRKRLVRRVDRVDPNAVKK